MAFLQNEISSVLWCYLSKPSALLARYALVSLSWLSIFSAFRVPYTCGTMNWPPLCLFQFSVIYYFKTFQSDSMTSYSDNSKKITYKLWVECFFRQLIKVEKITQCPVYKRGHFRNIKLSCEELSQNSSWYRNRTNPRRSDLETHVLDHPRPHRLVGW